MTLDKVFTAAEQSLTERITSDQQRRAIFARLKRGLGPGTYQKMGSNIGTLASREAAYRRVAKRAAASKQFSKMDKALAKAHTVKLKRAIAKRDTRRTKMHASDSIVTLRRKAAISRFEASRARMEGSK